MDDGREEEPPQPQTGLANQDDATEQKSWGKSRKKSTAYGDARSVEIQRDSGRRMDRLEVQVSQSFTGPLPPPEILAKYAAIAPDVAMVDRVLTIAESAQAHNQHQEKAALAGAIDNRKKGKEYAFVLSLVMILGAIFLIYNGHGILGSLFAGTTLIGLAYLFITGKRKK